MRKLLDYITNCLVEEKCQKLFFTLFMAFFVFVAFYSAMTAFRFNFFDVVEHIQSSWLVSEGKLPYKDFFEHHHPLLWYLFAPVVKLFYQNILIFPLAQVIGVIGYLLIIILIYALDRKFIYGEKPARLSLLILLSIPYIWNDITAFRPDVFMLLSFFGALYFFCSYLESKRPQKLALSYFLLAVAILFLQKILFIGLGFFLINLYYLYSKKIRFFDVVIAGICFIIPLTCFFIYLSVNGILADWYYCNFQFNYLLKEYYSGYSSGFSPKLPLATLLSIIVILRYYNKKDNQLVLISLYLFSLLSIIIFAPHPHYYILYWIFASVLLGNILYHARYFKYFYILLLIAAYINAYQLMPTRREQERLQAYKNNISYLWKQNISADDFMSLTKSTYTVFIPNLTYHWFGYHNIAVIDTIYHPDRYLDLKEKLEAQKPMFIAYEANSLLGLNDMLIYSKSKYFIRRNTAILRKAAKHPELLSKLITINSDFWGIDEEWVERNYERIEGTILWKRKA